MGWDVPQGDCVLEKCYCWGAERHVRSPWQSEWYWAAVSVVCTVATHCTAQVTTILSQDTVWFGPSTGHWWQQPNILGRFGAVMTVHRMITCFVAWYYTMMMITVRRTHRQHCTVMCNGVMCQDVATLLTTHTSANLVLQKINNRGQVSFLVQH